MRIFLFILLGFVFGMGAASAQDEVPFDASTMGTDGEVIAFVGEKIFVEKRNLEQETIEVTRPDGRTVTRTIPRWNDRFEVRYKVHETVSGNYAASEIDFLAFKHSGTLIFPEINPALLFAVNREGVWVYAKAPIYPVQKTTDGDWAICGSIHTPTWLEKYKPLATSYEEPIGFLNPPKTQIGEPCVTGTRADNIFAFQEKIRFAPDRRRRACNREMGERENIFFLSGKTPESKEKKQIHDACMARLAFHAATNAATPSKGRTR